MQNNFRKHLLNVSMFAMAALALEAFLAYHGDGAQKNGQPIVLKAVSAWPQTAFEVKNNFLPFLKDVQEKVAREYPGELEINYLGGPEVTPFREQVGALQTGTLDMVFTHTGYYTSLLPVLHLLNLSTMTPAEERMRGLNKVMNDIHEKRGIHFLGRLGLNLPFGLYLRKPIEKADLHGLRIRVSPSQSRFIKDLGGEPAMVPPTDIYIALQRGLLNGFVWPAGDIREWGWQDQVDYLVKPFFYPGVANVVLINLDTWKKLPGHLQKLLNDVIAIDADKFYDFNRSRREKELHDMVKNGVLKKIITLPKAEAQKYLRVARSAVFNLVLGKADKHDIEELAKVLNIAVP